MNILMLGRWLPPPRRPVRGTREYHLARRLAGAHSVTVGFINDSPDAAGSISVLRSEFGDLEFAAVPRGWKSLASAVRSAAGESCTLSYFRSEALRTRLADRMRRTRYDLVLVSSSSMIQYVFDMDPAIPLIVDFGEVDSLWWERQGRRSSLAARRFFRTEAMRLRAAECAVARRAARCLAATPEAASFVQRWAGATPAAVIRNGVDLEPATVARSTGHPTVVLNSSLLEGEFEDAVRFCREILPAVRLRVPETRFVLTSRSSDVTARAAAELVGLEVAATSADFRTLSNGRTVAVAPMWSGSDVHGSVLEPMAARLAVVATSKACERLAVDGGRDLCTAGEAPEFAARVVELLKNMSLREQVAAQGRVFVEAHFSWPVCTAPLEDIVRGVLGGVGGPPSPAAAKTVAAGRGA